jgi:hypothetical protein
MLTNASIQLATTLQGLPLAPISKASCLRLSPRRFVAPHGWIPAFAGMTRVGWSVEWLLERKGPLASSATARTDKERTPCVDPVDTPEGVSRERRRIEAPALVTVFCHFK